MGEARQGWRISSTGLDPLPARHLARDASRPLLTSQASRQTLLMAGHSPLRLAAIAEAAMNAGHRIVLVPDALKAAALPDGTLVTVTDSAVCTRPQAGSRCRAGWDVAMFTSGSTTRPRAFGFTTAQLAVVTGWYERIYQVTADSVIVTSLPVVYNFTLVAGVLLAARVGARLHLSATAKRVLPDAARLAESSDRVIVLANPVLLDQAADTCPTLPARVLVDSGGAPLSTTAIAGYRDADIDVREGYGLTETASLTHFDVEASTASLGTVGTAMPGIHTAIDNEHAKPVIEIAGPVTGTPLDPHTPPPGQPLRTTDLGETDTHGRLRLLGRADDEPINGMWPKDTLDTVGPLLGRRCALVRHPSPDAALIRLAHPLEGDASAVQKRAADFLGLAPDRITIDQQQQRSLLHSAKLPRDGKIAG